MSENVEKDSNVTEISEENDQSEITEIDLSMAFDHSKGLMHPIYQWSELPFNLNEVWTLIIFARCSDTEGKDEVNVLKRLDLSVMKSQMLNL